MSGMFLALLILHSTVASTVHKIIVEIVRANLVEKASLRLSTTSATETLKQELKQEPKSLIINKLNTEY